MRGSDRAALAGRRGRVVACASSPPRARAALRRLSGGGHLDQDTLDAGAQGDVRVAELVGHLLGEHRALLIRSTELLSQLLAELLDAFLPRRVGVRELSRELLDASLPRRVGLGELLGQLLGDRRAQLVGETSGDGRGCRRCAIELLAERIDRRFQGGADGVELGSELRDDLDQLVVARAGDSLSLAARLRHGVTVRRGDRCRSVGG